MTSPLPGQWRARALGVEASFSGHAVSDQWLCPFTALLCGAPGALSTGACSTQRPGQVPMRVTWPTGPGGQSLWAQGVEGGQQATAQRQPSRLTLLSQAGCGAEN